MQINEQKCASFAARMTFLICEHKQDMCNQLGVLCFGLTSGNIFEAGMPAI